MTYSDNLTTFKGKLRKHRCLYSLANLPYPAPRWHKLVRNLISELGAQAKILEVGAGTRRRAEHVINLELEAMPHVDIVADGHYLPFRAETFDAVILEAVLEHVQKPQQVVAEVSRILKRGGYVCAAVPFL